MAHDTFEQVVDWIGLGVDAGAALLIAIGAIEAFVRSIHALITGKETAGERKAAWLRFSVWLLLALEFELAADIIKSAIAPTWTSVGQLAAIAVIRTFLNYFLEHDIERAEHLA